MTSSNLSSQAYMHKDGLKCITVQISQIFKTTESITYNDLLGKISNKNVNTLKRRLYDVLSIFRALNLITKCNKMYTRTQFFNYTETLKQRIAEKKVKIEELINRKKSVSYLITRNKKIADFDDIYDKLFTPFFVASLNSSATVHCETNEERDFFVIRSVNQISIIDDHKIIAYIYEDAQRVKDNVSICDVECENITDVCNFYF